VAAPLAVTREGTTLAGEVAGSGPAVLALHGLTATRRYVLMGSRALERGGHTVIAYDARGHGASSPAAEGRYDYPALVADAATVLDAAGVERAVLAGVSMGAHTAVALALAMPERVAGLALVTPAFDPQAELVTASWDALAGGLRSAGIEGFLAAYDFDGMPAQWRAGARRVIEQRLAAQEHPAALADALEQVPRSRPFESYAQLATIEAPVVIVASRDEADPGHPLALAEHWARTIPGAQLAVEDPGQSPLAWQGGRVSALIAELVAAAPRESA
jgi:pimeloyl-ACP methyl ester carboxylesterase